jgi:hypothetical protein
LNVLIGGWKKIENRLSSAIFRGPRQCNKSEPSFSSTADALWRVTAPGRGRHGQCQLRCSDAPGLPCTQEQSRVMSVAHWGNLCRHKAKWEINQIKCASCWGNCSWHTNVVVCWSFLQNSCNLYPYHFVVQGSGWNESP